MIGTLQNLMELVAIGVCVSLGWHIGREMVRWILK